MKALLIDHDDSFTHNLRHWLSPGFRDVCVVHHLKVTTDMVSDYDFIALSPGPKSPSDYPHSLELLKSVPNNKPVFGVCLGMQMMVHCEGGTILPYSPPLHGKTSLLKVSAPELASVADIKVARYHSLCCRPDAGNFRVTAYSVPDDVPMCIEHKTKKWLGFQFHPESFLTENSALIFNLVITWAKS